MTPFSSVAILEKLALLKIAACNAPALSRASSARLRAELSVPINPEAWLWYHRNIGHEKAPIVDTWWQTETGAILISPLPGVTTTKPGSATFPLPGIVADIVDAEIGRASCRERV